MEYFLFWVVGGSVMCLSLPASTVGRYRYRNLVGYGLRSTFPSSLALGCNYVCFCFYLGHREHKTCHVIYFVLV